MKHFWKPIVWGTCILAVAMLRLSEGRAAESSVTEWSARSPDERHEVVVALRDGRLTYRLQRHAGGRPTEVIAASPLGLETDAGAFVERLEQPTATTPTKNDVPYEMITGKRRQLRDQHTAFSVSVANGRGARLGVDFRVYNDGLAFRYRLAELPAGGARVTAERTAFRFPTEGKVWMQPFSKIAEWAPAYEEYFTNGTPLGKDSPHEEGWAFPGLFETQAGWVLLTEADLDGRYFGARLHAKTPNRTYTIQLPGAETAMGIGAVEPTITAPWESPWRVIVAGESLATITESSLVHHVSRPPAPRDWSWAKPGRATWSWWAEHSSPRDFNAITPFIDLAAKWGWEYSLVDANWNIMKNGDIEQLLAYARERGVGLLLWYNSGGDHNEITEQPRGRLGDRAMRRAEFAKLQRMGVKGVKVDFFHSDKQWMIQHYLGILEDAADFQLVVDFHGCTLPRGWERTYPNLMTMEAVRGAEVYSCCEDNGPNAVWQNTILPFTRNVVGSMDYTPVTFTDQKVPHQTTFAHELALSVLFESGVQHFADSVAGYLALPEQAQAWLRNVPVAWDETRFVDGYPGQLAVLARRKGDTWYVAGAEGAKQARTLALSLPFLAAGRHAVEVIADGKDDRSFAMRKQTLDSGSKLEVALRPAGGFVARISPAGAGTAAK